MFLPEKHRSKGGLGGLFFDRVRGNTRAIRCCLLKMWWRSNPRPDAKCSKP
jgi:hypothetical protein